MTSRSSTGHDFNAELALHRAAVARAQTVEPDAGAEIDAKDAAPGGDGADTFAPVPYNTISLGSPRIKLPEPALFHLEALEAEARERNLTVVDLWSQLYELRQDRMRIQQRIDQLTGPPNRLSADDPRLVDENRRLDRLNKKIEPLERRHAEKQALWTDLAGLVGAVDHWIVGKTCRMYEGPVPQLRKSETFGQAVEARRRRLRELKADRAKHAAAPTPAAKAKELVRAEVAKYAELGCPDVAPVIDHGEAARWPIAGMNRSNFGSLKAQVAGGDSGQVFDGAAMLCWLFRDQVIAALEKEIDALASDEVALSAEDRARLIAECDRDACALEIEEEQLIRAAAESGQPIERRRDASPEAVLLVRLD